MIGNPAVKLVYDFNSEVLVNNNIVINSVSNLARICSASPKRWSTRDASATKKVTSSRCA